MLFGEWLRENENFVSEIELPDESISHELLSYILTKNYGERIIHEPMRVLDGKEVAKVINMMYNSKWKEVQDYLTNSNELGVVSSKEMKEDFDGTVNVNASGEVFNLESAFNIDGFVGSDKQENTADNEQVNVNSRTRKEDYKSSSTANRQIMNMNNSQLSNVITKDIVNELCLQIY